MVKEGLKLISSYNYSAYENGFGYFRGGMVFEDENRNRIIKFYKIVCPNCSAEGKSLEHLNWYMSKEEGQDLIIKCRNCGYNINTETEEFEKCKIIIKRGGIK